MKWQKAGIGEGVYYTPFEGKKKYHKTSELSNEDMNSKELKFTNNDNWLSEYVKDDSSDESIESSLPSGIYKLKIGFTDSKLWPIHKPKNRKLFDLDIVKEVIKDFKDFRSSQHIYDELNILYKRGILLYGPPGTGKTSAINLIIDSLQKQDILVIYLEETLSQEVRNLFRCDSRMKVLIFEELTHVLADGLNYFLKFLDGEDSLSNTYIIGTTNYPEMLPSNIVDRPGRFDKLFEIKYPSAKDRKKYLEHYLKRTVTKDELEITKDLSLAYLKELLVISIRDGLKINEIITQIESRKKLIANLFAEPNHDSLGF